VAANGVRDHMGDHEPRQPFERKAMDQGSEELLDRPDGMLDFTDVAIGGGNVHLDLHRAEELPYTLELVVRVNVTNPKTAGLVQTDGAGESLGYGIERPIRNRDGGAVPNSAGDRVKEIVPLYKEEINTEGDIHVVLSDG
jgi:hypothetical protein